MDYYAAVRVFLSAAETLSFSQSARQLETKISTVSRYVARLETELGVALFNRSTHGLTLTEGGMIFRDHARQSIQNLEQGMLATASLNQSPRGQLRVTVPVSFGRRHIIRHLPEFLLRYPDIAVDVMLSDEVLNLIDSALDLAIRIGNLPDSQMMARRLASHQRIVCASPDYIAKHGRPNQPEQLSQHQALRFSLASDDRWLLVQTAPADTASQSVAVRLQGSVRANDTESLLQLALSGCGLALLPNWCVNDALKNGELVRLLPEWQAQVHDRPAAVWAIYPPKKKVSSKVRSFVDFYAERFSANDYWQA